MRFSRDLLVFSFLFTLLIGLITISAIQRAQSEREALKERAPYSTHSTQENGALALQLWLEAAGYRTQRIENQAFGVSDDARVLFILGPFVDFDQKGVDSILRWVERGNTLIVAQELPIGSERLLRPLKVQLRYLDRHVQYSTIEQPLLGHIAGSSVAVNAFVGLSFDRSDYISYLSAQGKPLLVSFSEGKGKVWLCSTPSLFANTNLDNAGNAALVMAMLSRAPRGSLIEFDEYHLGFTGTENAQGRKSIQALLFSTPWGWAILYAFFVLFAYLLVNGQRFGRAVPLPKDIERRSPAEYVASMANLYRRADKRHLILDHYQRQLKRRLGKPYRVNPDLPDKDFVEELARSRDNLDRDSLLRILCAQDEQKISEKSLVKLADQAIKFTAR